MPYYTSFRRRWRARDWWPSRAIVQAFHRVWYDSYATWEANRFLGYRILQCPFDLQIYQELIVDLKPQAIVQTGVCAGGSILYFASMLDLAGAGPEVPVIGIDIAVSAEARTLIHPRIHLIEGDAVATSTRTRVADLLDGRSAMVVLDSDHSRDHVLRELHTYADLVPSGGSLVVEDTNIGHPVRPDLGPGPYEAVETWLPQHPEFQHDDRWKRLRLSFHAHGWLHRL